MKNFNCYTLLHICYCFITAQNLLSTMNRSVDPCEDFYEFACGNFYRLHPLSDYKTETDWFDIGSELLLNKISGKDN